MTDKYSDDEYDLANIIYDAYQEGSRYDGLNEYSIAEAIIKAGWHPPIPSAEEVRKKTLEWEARREDFMALSQNALLTNEQAIEIIKGWNPQHD